MAIYLDHNATTVLDRRVLEAMLPYLQGATGNPSSVHTAGRRSRQAIEQARQQVADLVGAQANQIIFTGTGTEANNLALKGFANAHPASAMAFSAIEHESILACTSTLEKLGWRIDSLASDENSVVVQTPVAEDVKLISVGLANNETGVVQDLSFFAAQAKRVGAVLHTDAVQAVGKIPVHFPSLGAHLMTFNSHKLYGPLGVGALVYDRAISLWPLVEGGGQEQNLRSGTENIPAIVGFGHAAFLAQQELEMRTKHVLELHRYFEEKLTALLPGIRILAKDAPHRLSNTSLISVPGIESEMLLMLLDKAQIYVSSGSACASQTGKPSHVLQAMHLPSEVIESVMRVSFGKDNTLAEVDTLLAELTKLSHLAGHP